MPGGPAAASPLARALDWLAARDRSEREIRERLARWGLADAEGAALLATLRERGLVDDGRLAERICDWHDRHDPLGPLRLRERLARRGIAAADGEAAIAARAPEAVQLALAERLLARRGAALAALPPAQGRRRLHDFLARRGFSAGVRRALCARRWPAGAGADGEADGDWPLEQAASLDGGEA
ncbi:hypothetical protein FJ251_08100 [bacterium]|nr:hypothetical protein [bacterium]